jgi:hypothetical protein
MELRKEKNKFERRESEFMWKMILFIRRRSKSLLSFSCMWMEEFKEESELD